ncbi:FAD-dependent monooxygenase [Archangium violaceum]|uniref:NAD(P)/FAD-dependent oxidoreductase n=1 Tax=Archangium violaceum TaxID=83451 RepID=UPI00193B2ABF|nr:NAD(P)/FAD-dependent oxidoreductase [Archangium violaceum]QRK04535.1 FAD-dependent monooxygenase [Archangium violaceum]
MSTTRPSSEPYDVIIVGGRPAGATLAMRLGRHGMRVLIVDRANFPSAPPVSVPFLMNSAMSLLDELEVPESEYAHDAPRLRHFFVEYKDYFRAHCTIAEVGGRDYIYTVDRARLDGCLWNHLSRFDSVTRLEGAHVNALERDASGRISGIKVRLEDGTEQVIAGRCVVGADGRYSLVAREAGARVTEQRTDVDTSSLYAYWSGYAPYDAEPTGIQIHTAGDGFSLIVMPTTEGRAGVVFQGRSDRFLVTGDAQAYYLEGLRRYPAIWRRLAHATQVSSIRGIKRIGNLYRQAGGPGWVLVGDAFHQKDTIDAQGIYDALLESKLLAAALVDWKQGAVSWEEAIARYEREALSATRAMFHATLDRVKREIYTELPPWAARSVLRWMMTDGEYMRRFSLLLARRIAPEGWAPPNVLLGALARGITNDLRRLVPGARG